MSVYMMHINNEGPERTSNDHDGLLKGYTPTQVVRESAIFPIPLGSLPLPNYPDRLTVEILKDDEQYVKGPLQGVIAKYVTGSKTSPYDLRDTSTTELEHYIRYTATLVDAWEIVDFDAVLKEAKGIVAKSENNGVNPLLRVAEFIQVELVTVAFEHEIDKIAKVYEERGFRLEAKATARFGLQMLASEVIRTTDWSEFEIELKLVNGHAELVLHHDANTRVGFEQ